MHVTEQEQREINLPGGPAIIVVVAPEVLKFNSPVNVPPEIGR